ncbi:MAG: PAS domain S-box protein [Thermodesulfobacteriota bacterium]|nr:PAS domain S-box protein [Thermodesulfobacteriota bacterium]
MKIQPVENPTWILPVLLAAGILFALVSLISLLLRKQVAAKTEELREVNHTLAMQIGQLQTTETALRESEEMHRNLLETTSEGFLMVDAELKILVVNESLCNMLDQSQEDLLGKTPFDFVDDENKRILLENTAKISDSTHRSYELVQKKMDGSTLHGVVNATTLLDKENNVQGAFAFITDITERKRTATALQAEKELLTVTLRSIGDAVITTNIEGKVTFLNRVAENLTGWTDAEASGKSSQEVFNIINEKTGERCASPVQRVIELGRIIGLANHTALIAKDGSIKSIADSGAPIRDAESKIIGVVIVFRDVTNEQRMEEELLKGRKLEAVGVLAGGIAHDFNNILAAILGNIELACHRIPETNGKVIARLQEAQKATKRATKLTQQLLTFSKGGDPVKGATSLPELIKDSADFVLPGSKTFCEYNFAADLWQVDIDSGQISQVIQNIIINADHAMPEGGTIEINCVNIEDPVAEALLSVHEGRFVRISIRDTGIGIPREIIDKIFDPYFSTKQHGSGLGLAICHSIINKHDGYLTVDSVPGKGTTFTFYLPAVFSVASSTIENTKISHAVRSSRIMIMDDEEMLLTLAESQLEALGHEAVLVTDGEQAINKYQELQDSGTPVDLVIMDLTIPGGVGGQEAAERLLKIAPEAKLVVASGYSNDPIMANYKDYGFRAAIAKPFDLRDLSDAIAAVL